MKTSEKLKILLEFKKRILLAIKLRSENEHKRYHMTFNRCEIDDFLRLIEDFEIKNKKYN